MRAALVLECPRRAIVARTSDEAAILAQHVLTALELRAVKTAQPTPGRRT